MRHFSNHAFAAFGSIFVAAILACASSLAAEEAKTPPNPPAPPADGARTEEKKDETSKPNAKKDPKAMTLDELEAASLCPVKKIESKQIYHYELNGKTYHFCCRVCQTEFENHPEKYGAKAEKAEK